MPVTLSWPVSQLVSQSQFEELAYLHWQGEPPPPYHRKHWEFAYIAQALDVRGLLKTGKRGLGFGVGREPLPVLFAQHGAEILATDSPIANPLWDESGQYSRDLFDLPGMTKELTQLVTHRPVDMTAVPYDLHGQFDFVWSAGSLEHLGSLGAGIDFIWSSLACLKPGGTAVHTTEYNLSSNENTLDGGEVVIYRECDIKALAYDLIRAGYEIELNLERGNDEFDRYIDPPPYKSSPHIRLLFGGYVMTSIGLIIHKPEAFNGY